ncbi:hypothetical protein Hdeb2414_s0010g00339951 [Helianthus debilis subsp. tardiflorus]
MTKFTGELLSNYGLHITQINSLGLPLITHFEFICRANRIKPTFEMFSFFYIVNYTGGFYSFNSQTSALVLVVLIHRKVCTIGSRSYFIFVMGSSPSICIIVTRVNGSLGVNVSVNFVDQEWYKTLTRKATSICQIEDRALVRAGMSMLWVPKNPRGVPVYGYDGKVGYSLLNVLDPKAAGAMVEAVFAEGKPVW